MPIKTEKYNLALAVRIKQGQITANGQLLPPGSKSLPEGFLTAGDYIIIPENALLDTVGSAVFFIHPAVTVPKIVVSPDEYAEVHGDDSDFRICVTAPTQTRGVPKEDGRKNKTPVSYLHYYVDRERRPFLELQANEGCIRVALHNSPQP